MRALTAIFVGLVALPGLVLAWLGFQYAGTLETRTREGIERDLDAEMGRQVREAKFEFEATLEQLRFEFRRKAQAIAADLPFERPGERWIDDASVFTPLGSIEVRAECVDARGLPIGPRDLIELPEWPAFVARRDEILRSGDWTSGEPFVSPRLQRRLRALSYRGIEETSVPPDAWTFEESLPQGSRLLLHVRWPTKARAGRTERGLRTLRRLVRSSPGAQSSLVTFGVRSETVIVSAACPFRIHVLVQHPDAEALAAATPRRRWLTIAAIAALVALMAVGLWLARRALARERAARQLRDAFIANVSHELRTPLTSVRLYAEMLGEGGLPEEKRREYGRVVDAEGARLAALVDDMLDFAALERGARELEIEPTDVARATRAVVEAWRPLAEREGVALEVVGPGEGEVALADATAFGRILTNLLQNALKHGRPARDGGASRIRVLIDGSISVCDNGPGIGRREREMVFERFRRGVDAGNRAGAGIGLALARELAVAMGGELDLEDDGEWTRFTLRLEAA